MPHTKRNSILSIRIVFALMMLLITTISFGAVDTTPIQRSDILAKVKAEFQGSDDLNWLGSSELDTLVTEDGHFMSIVMGQVVSERLSQLVADNCPESPINGRWERSCIDKLKKIQDSMASFQQEWFETLEDDLKKDALEASLKELDKLASKYYENTDINYGFEWGYGALKTGLDIMNTATSDSDTARVEAAWKLVSAISHFGPQAALASGYVNFLFDFIHNYDRDLKSSWSNMYFGFYMYTKANGSFDTYFRQEGNIYYPRQGTFFYNLMNGLDQNGRPISFANSPLADPYGYDYDEYTGTVDALLNPLFKSIGTSKLTDVIKEGNGLIAFYENRPQITSNDVQVILQNIIDKRNFYLSDNSLFDYISNVVSKTIYLQLNTPETLSNVYLVDTAPLLSDEQSQETVLAFSNQDVVPFTLNTMTESSDQDTTVNFSLFSLLLERNLTDFSSRTILASF